MKAKRPAGRIIKGITDLFSLTARPLKFTRITEKFEVVRRSSYNGWVLRLDGE